MISCYMFEAKFIQKYIFRTGKLRDVIASSERLEQLIDTDDNDILSRILEKIDSNNDIKFIRRKGGAFYAYTQDDNHELLLRLRKEWTLVVQQFFPELGFVDAFNCAEKLQDAIDLNYQTINGNRNNPSVKVPLFKSNMQLSARTARPAINVDRITNETMDADTKTNRSIYSKMKKGDYNQFLYKKFSSLDQSIFPLDLDPHYSDSDSEENNQTFPYLKNKYDLALIHIDGNNFGLLLRELKSNLSELEDNEYAQVFLKFSKVLCNATKAAAQNATQKLIDSLNYDEEKYLPMRPLIMGGDDITLFCRADLAIEYSKNFCSEFKKQTESKLKFIESDETLKELSLPSYLTASGGIIFQKAKQPFTVSHQLVEDLCQKAKVLTKENNGEPAIAFARIEDAQQASYQQLFNNRYETKIGDTTFNKAMSSYLVSDKKDAGNLNCLLEIVSWIKKNPDYAIKTFFKKILMYLSHNNLEEAKQLTIRVNQRYKNEELKNLKKMFAQFSPKNSNEELWWLWDKDENTKETILEDILDLLKYQGEDQ